MAPFALWDDLQHCSISANEAQIFTEAARAIASSGLESHFTVIRPLPSLRLLYNICSMYITASKQNSPDITADLL